MNRLITLLVLLGVAMTAQAEEPALEHIQVDAGLPTLERGATVLMEVCNGCHGMKYVHYRDLVALGISKDKVEEWRGDQPIESAIASQMSPEAAMESFAKIPPDLSMMARAREGGADYLYTYLIGYYNTPEGETKNRVFPETKMPDPLGISYTDDEAGRNDIKHKAHDVASFLYWASDPHEQERHRMGYYVLAYLFVLTTLLFLVKKQVWSRLDRQNKSTGSSGA